ncbi:MAG: CoA transferase [Candidatus Dormibacteraceae bacterium]
MSQTPTGPLTGTTVLEFTHVLAGPYAGTVLADLGAEVIKVEDAGHPDFARATGPHFAAGESLYFMSLNWGKRSLGVNLKSPGGQGVVAGLARTADVLLDNYRPGVMARLGLDHQTVAAFNPRIITCSISGFGETGPDAGKAGYDYTIQAKSGVMSLTGEPDGAPGRAGISYVDHSGGLAAALAVCAALVERGRTGVGRHVDLGLLDVQVSMLTYLGGWQLNAGEAPGRTAAGAHPSLVPAQNFATRDGYMSIFVGNDSIWARFVEAMADPALANPRYATNGGRLAGRAELVTHLAGRFRESGTADWAARLDAAGVPCSPVNTVQEALIDEQVLARGLVSEAENPRYGTYRHVAGPISGMSVGGRRGSPVLGEDTSAILAALGYSQADVAGLVASGDVFVPTS